MVSFASSIMKKVVVFLARSRFPLKLICCIAFESDLVLVVYINLLLSVGRKYRLLLLRCASFSNDKIKILFTPRKLGSINWFKYRFCACDVGSD